MQIDSSARPTCLRLRSAVECTATVLMPRLWQARSTRSAISPRLAMTTFSSMGMVVGRSGDHEHGLVELHRLAVLHQDGLHRAADVGFDLVEHLHGFDDAQRLARLDLLADLDESSGARGGRGIEGADHRR